MRDGHPRPHVSDAGAGSPRGCHVERFAEQGSGRSERDHAVLSGLFFALCSMLLNSVANLLQSDAARWVSRRRPLVVQPRYLGSLIVDGLGWACSVFALRYLPVFEVQAILAGAIAVTALLARMYYGSVLRPVDRLGIGACLLGLGLVAGSAEGHSPPGVSGAVEIAFFVGFVALVVLLVVLWRNAPAWPLAIVAGLGFGGTSVAVRAVQSPSGGQLDLPQLLSQPPVYLVVAFWVIGLVGWSRALQVGSLAPVTAVFMVTEVVAPGTVGILLLGDSVRPGWWPAMVFGMLLAILGSMVLARSPVQNPPTPARVH